MNHFSRNGNERHSEKEGDMNQRFLLGLDIGSSSVKAALLDSQSGHLVAAATSPEKELPIIAHQPGWAEQDPSTWWTHVKRAVGKISDSAGSEKLKSVAAIGISYQMHGLVVVDKDLKPLRPSIIWCDSRAVQIGNQAFSSIGTEKCLRHLLNSPGNFTASKLKWVKDNEPDIYKKAYKIMLPGDYVATRLTGQIATTPSGLSEGILWDFDTKTPAHLVLDEYDIDQSLLPEIHPVFSSHGTILPEVASELGLSNDVIVSYRGGDQPNNALSLNVLEPGEIATTAGTSGVVYGVLGTPSYDRQSRVNTFAHVNYTPENPRLGVLLCVNGTGILNSWVRANFMSLGDQGLSYQEMNSLAAQAPVGAEGISVLPYGNGAERTLSNRCIGGSIHGLDFNRHRKSHVLRATQEGIVFALKYGVDIMAEMGLRISKVRAGHANMFLSPVFSKAFATVMGAEVELLETDGAQGAARGAGIGAGIYASPKEAFIGLAVRARIAPEESEMESYSEAYARWKKVLTKTLETEN